MKTDLVICRAGALTISELAIVGTPALLVPLPTAIDNHQSINGSVLVACGGARLLDQSTLTGPSLRLLLHDLAGDPDKLRKMSECVRDFSKPNAAQDICDLCFEIIQHG